MKKQIQLFIFIIILSDPAISQIKQNIRGRVVDQESKIPLSGVGIAVYMDSVFIAGTISDTDGTYIFKNIPLGRISVIAKYIGYAPFIAPVVELTSGKETVMNIEMEETGNKLDEVVVTAIDKIKTNNSMAMVSARLFSIDETSRYPGSRGEPSRMARNFAGVNGTDDSNNDIIVRGNSAAGVLWRVEGVDIPNPNHFATLGSTGGAVSILNSKLIANSDFFTGAFPAEYGNANAAVFDVRFKSGNNEHHEFSAGLGILGAELSVEGPLKSKSHSSYLFAYRYSSLGLFHSINIPIGTSSIPRYQDLSFKLNFPLKKNAVVTIFGLSGASRIDIVLSKAKQNEPEIYSGNNYDEYTRYDMGVMGFSYAKSINENTFHKVIVSCSVTSNRQLFNLIYREPDFSIDSIVFNSSHNFKETKASLHWFLNKKVGVRTTLKLGIIGSEFFASYLDTSLDDSSGTVLRRYDKQSSFILLQPYFQFKVKLTTKVTMNAGINLLYSDINHNTFAVNPRAGIRWEMTSRRTVSLGYGIHSQAMHWYNYFLQEPLPGGQYYLPNNHTSLYHSHHFILAYDWTISRNLRLKTETYYQYLFKVPVSKIPSSYSILNEGPSVDLINTGLGRNFGIEFTLEKFYSNNYYYMLTYSLYQSEYKASNGKWYNTNFNGHYILNILGGKEFKFRDSKIIGAGAKVTYAGSQRYGPVDTAKTIKLKAVVQVDDKYNSEEFAPYFRTDLRIYYKLNMKKITHEFSIDLVNIFDTKNILSLAYGPDPGNPRGYTINTNYQLGFLPLFNYKIDF